MLRRSILRSYSTLTSKAMSNQMSPFTKTVVEVMRDLYPEALADKSFDNTGLLLEAPSNPNQRNSVLLTIDLTKGVADEAINRKDSLVIAYHPIIFKPIKSLTFKDSQQATLLRLAQHGISVYSPHTALDAAVGGINDWLVDCLTSEFLPSEAPQSRLGGSTVDYIDLTNMRTKHDSNFIVPVTGMPDAENAGYGRILRFDKPESLDELLGLIRRNLKLKGLSVAVPQSVTVGTSAQLMISSVGICPGSGGSLLRGVDVDMLFTGELSHHEALAAIESGKIVVTTFHSNTERRFLSDRLAPQLRHKISHCPGFDGVAISEVDRDPFEYWQA